MSGYPKPVVFKWGVEWMVIITRGFSGNYEDHQKSFVSWRDAFDWAYNEVKDWNPSLRHWGHR